MRATFAIALACALVAIGVLGYITLVKPSQDETYRGPSGQARYCHDIGADYIAATDSCRAR